MALGWARLSVLVASVLLVSCGCSSTSAGTAHSTSSTNTAPADAAAVQTYLSAVNALCSELLPKVIAVTHGGSLDVPVKDYLAQQPAHAKLLADFDRQLALVPVPPAAKDKAAAFAGYVAYANQLDAKRLAAASHGATAYANEIKAEAAAGTDTSVTARNAAGFDSSCDAR